ncbi:2Fe-2S iron-sulfur cluster-binding protein [Sphingopyxis granuli]|uniref:Ferredoxin reductase-like n=2 Tax=Sphingopyxis TaxID=165697 RepID=Q687Z8_SPHMC|nr:2Fe-2S iron-sulfur cluster-binding protein [Sphingopyxis granuli]AAU12856.1 ferredoxin reductase-like [Sphingopyxis macrogoltabida]
MEITLIPDRRTLEIQADETLLDALLRHDEPISHSCRDGRCGLCKCSFSVQGLTPERGTSIEMSPVLACQTVPNADCIVEIADPDDVLVLPPQIARGRVEAIESPVERVRRLILSTDRTLKFEPGQYFEVTWSPDITRMYSAAGLPTDPTLVFDIQLHNLGRASEHVADALRTGDTAKIKGPLGAAYLRRKCTAPILCISNNTGLGSLLGFLRGIAKAGMRNPVYVYAGFLMSEYVYGEEDLRQVCKLLKDLRRCATVVGGGTLKRWDRLGLLPDIIGKDFDDLSEFRVYAFGSPHAIDVTSRLLRNKGVAPDRLHSEPYHFSVS